MLELPKEISDFLKMITETNSGKSTVDGFPADVYKGINLDEKLNMFTLGSGYNIDSKYDGRSEYEQYLFKAEAFLPVIKELMRSGKVVIELDGVGYFSKNSWDHSYSSPDDYSSRYIQKGHINGSLKLENHIFIEYNLNFTPKGNEKELESDVCFITDEEIKEIKRQFHIDA